MLGWFGEVKFEMLAVEGNELGFEGSDDEEDETWEDKVEDVTWGDEVEGAKKDVIGILSLSFPFEVIFRFEKIVNASCLSFSTLPLACKCGKCLESGQVSIG